jgi:hypothetical protein
MKACDEVNHGGERYGFARVRHVADLRDYEQYNGKNLFHGNPAVASFTAVFPAAKSMESSSLK